MGKPSTHLLEMPLSFSNDRDSYIFKLKCKNTGRDFVYDFTAAGRRYPSIASAFISAIVATRNTIGHNRRSNVLRGVTRLLDYLDTLQAIHGRAMEFREINSTILANYAPWVKQYGTQTPLSKSYNVSSIHPMIRWLRRNHPDAHPDLALERNLFPMAHRSVVARKPYTSIEWNDLLKAIAAEVKEAKRRLEVDYVFRWKGMPAPLDDVAPFDEGRPPQKQHALWDAIEHVIWWWENLTQCQRLNDYAIRQLPQSSTGLASIARMAKRGEFGEPVAGKSYVNMFYDWVGAGPSYAPRYLGQPSPIRYRNRFRKPEFLRWYWENELNGRVVGTEELTSGRHYGFMAGAKSLYGGLVGFYDAMGARQTVTFSDLLPYLLLLAVRTALNVSVIAGLTIDCIRPAPAIANPSIEEPNQWQIDWEKVRSFTQGATIPTHVRHDLMPVSVILRVMQITSNYRGGSKRLWISEKGEIMSTLQKEIADFVAKHGLMELGDNGQLTPFKLQISRIRPTIAMREYVRTENMAYIQTLLGHRSMGQTVQYVSQMNSPILLSRRGVHQDAMFLDLTGNGDVAIQLLEAHGIGVNVAKALTHVGSEHQGMLNSCRDPRNSPQPGQTSGTLCTSNACLSCQNLIVTNRDLHKYFCFIRYHESMLASGYMDEASHELATAEVAHVFSTCVIPKFLPKTIELAKRQAIEHPLPEWRIGAAG